MLAIKMGTLLHVLQTMVFGIIVLVSCNDIHMDMVCLNYWMIHFVELERLWWLQEGQCFSDCTACT